ncbi:MAG: serine--tRNA ligase [Rickettsiales bacterium]|nr:serine--tRNA ligase [Rickettsiales bacterium]
MLDIKFIRNNPEIFDAKIRLRNCDITSKEILTLDEEKRKKISAIQELQSQRNDIASQIAKIKKEGGNADDLFAKSKEVNGELKILEEDFTIDEKLNNLLASIPNLADDDVPVGKSEEDNVEIEKFGTPKKFSFTPKAHEDLGENLGMLDFEKSTKMSGSRFSSLIGDLAKLERALSNFMLDIAGENGYTEISPPNIVKSEAMYNSGQLPKFGDDAFSTKDDYWLIPTAEVSLVNFAIAKNLKEENFPMRLTAYTPCFRREAGSAGKDTRGMIRQHQFKKVELVSITTPQESKAEHEKMTNIACDILKKLELPFRKILLCTGDMGFGSQKTYDLEVWFPSQNKYREISSCSNCGDFQARRAGIKYKKDKENIFAHTLNGSSLAVGRTLIAILENYQNEDGSITVPEILVSYMGGINKIG